MELGTNEVGALRRRLLTGMLLGIVVLTASVGCSQPQPVSALPALTAQGDSLVPQATGTGSRVLGHFRTSTSRVFVAITCRGPGEVTLSLPPSSVRMSAGCTSPTTSGGTIGSGTVTLDPQGGEVRAVVHSPKHTTWKLLVSKDSTG
jgi:hypothetical protein